MYVVYIDVLFVINLVMDTIIFFLVSMIMNVRPNKVRLIISGTLASVVYCIFTVTPLLKNIPGIIYSSFIPIIPILYLFKPKDNKRFMKYYIVAMLVSLLLGGATFSLWGLLGNDMNKVNEVNIFMIIMIATVFGGIFYYLFYGIRRRFILPSFEYEITLVRNDKKLKLEGILDTGNLLYTPITHKPVVVVYYDDISELMNKNEREICEKYQNNIEMLIEKEGLDSIKYLIPFNNVGCSNGMITGIEVSEMIINKAGFEKKFKNCVVGITMNPLFRQSNYKLLLHPEYIFEEVG